MGIRTLIDLRTPHERAKNPYAIEGMHNLHLPLYSHISPALFTPFFIGRHRLDVLYELFLRRSALQFRRIVEALIEPDALPALIHCTLGKDRTGLAIALILSALDVPNELIVEDYALTAKYASAAIQAQAQHMRAHPIRAAFLPLLSVEPQHMAHALAFVEHRFGNAHAYFTKADVAKDKLDSLEQRLTT